MCNADGMQATSYGIPMEATADMGYALEVCARLNIWTQEPIDSPLVSLIQQHVAKLVARTQCLAQQLSHFAFPQDSHRTREITDTLQSVKTTIFETLALFDFCSSVERDGDEGALNALFSSLFLLHDDRVDLGEVRYLTDRIHRSRQETYAILSRWFGPEATSCNWRWGLGPKPPVDIIENLLPEIYALFTRQIARFSPRYIHTFCTTQDVPYIVDSSTLLTSGSYGIVRKVMQSQTQELFAQKTFQKVFSTVDRKNVLKELGVLELCFHRNIIRLIDAYDVDEEPHSIHIVMAPWAPYTLLQFLRSSDTRRKAQCPWFDPGLLTSDVCIYRMMYEIADAVHYLHRLSIKHKDIKPDNILLYREQTRGLIPIITDVGNSKVFRRGSNTNYVKSSYQYLSPEQLKHEESSLKADIWQLGCCFAMLLTVARGGTSAMNRLWTTFERTDENCSCNIARESDLFMSTLRGICTPGSVPQESAHAVTCRMLESDPCVRIDIEAVRKETERLPRH